MSDLYPFASRAHPLSSTKQRVLDGLNGLTERMGYSVIVRRRPSGKEFPQATVAPIATFAPWTTDAEFRAVYDRISTSTMVDVYRCYELWQLTGEVSHIDGAILEVGSWRGGTGAILARRSQSLGFAENVYVCDTFRGLVKVGAHDAGYSDGMYSDCSSDEVRRLYAGLGLENVRVLEGIFPDETAAAFTEESVRLCHVDVDIHDAARDVVEWVWPRLSVGGIVVFDDYGQAGPVGITRYVESMRQRPDRVLVHNLNGHAIVIKIR